MTFVVLSIFMGFSAYDSFEQRQAEPDPSPAGRQVPELWETVAFSGGALIAAGAAAAMGIRAIRGPRPPEIG